MRMYYEPSGVAVIREETPSLEAEAVPEKKVTLAIAEETESSLDNPWFVVLFNDHIHSFDDVIIQLVKAIGCPIGDAERLALQVHTQGKAGVFEGSFEKCFRVQSVLREIELVTEIQG